ncbi:MAG: hypothetical protein WCA20_11835 [Candidatus Sulfotelmatobacter sp.]
MSWKQFWMVVCIGLVASTLFAENPFVGKWKIDVANSHMTGTTDSVTAEGPNQWKFQDGSVSWGVKADGSDQPAPFGSTVAMQAVDASTWQFTNKSNGKVISHETWVLSADGKSMTRTFNSQGPSGEPVSGVASMKRIAGTRGFEGTWESTDVKLPFSEVDIEPNGDDGITVLLPEDGTGYSLKFDGKEYPEHSPRLPAGITVSAEMTGARTLRAHTRQNGKVFDTEDWEVSADGKTFTYKQLDEGTTEPVVIVQHRIEGAADAERHPHVADADREYAAVFSHGENPCAGESTSGYERCIGKEVQFTEYHLITFLEAVRGILADEAGVPAGAESAAKGKELDLLNQADGAWREYKKNLCELEFAGFDRGSGAAAAESECEYRVDREYVKQVADATLLKILAK